MADEKSEEEPTLLDLLKQHIRLEDDMDPSMLQFYLDAAAKYVQRKVGHSVKYLQLMVATVMNDNRSAGDDLAAALEALEPIFYLEVRTDDPDSQSNEPTQVDSHTVGT